MKYFDYLTPANRWDAAAEFPVEFLTAARIISEYVAAGDKLLDLDGDVGRLGMYFADMGCSVTLVDRSANAIEFVKYKAKASFTDISVVCGDISNVEDRFDLIIARYDDNENSERLNSVSQRLKDHGTLALWVTTPAYEVQKLLQLCPDKLPEDIIPADPDNIFVNAKHIKKLLNNNGLSVSRIFSPTGILTMADSSVIASRDDAFVRLMDLSISACDKDAVISASTSLIFICNKEQL